MKKLMFLQQTGGGSVVIEDTVSGNPVVFTTDLAKPLRRLSLSLLPRQSGSGDPSPSNVRPISGWSGVTAWRTGKNLVNIAPVKVTSQTVIGGYFALKAGTYSFSVTVKNNSSIHGAIKITVNGTQVGQAVAIIAGTTSRLKIQNITIDKDSNMVGIVISGASAGYDFDISDVMVELGSTASEYAEYAGASSPVVFPAMGKNLAKFSAESYADSQKCTYELTETGIEVTATGTYARRLDVFRVVKGQTYTISFKGVSTGNYNIVYFQKAATWLNDDRIGSRALSDTLTDYTFTFVAETDIVAVGCYVTASGTTGSMELSDFMLESGDTAHAYEPYTNTVYGGTLDLVSGVLTVDRAMVDLGTLHWATYSSPDIHVFRASYPNPRPFIGNNALLPHAICSSYYPMAYNQISRNDNGAFSFGNERTVVIDHRFSDAISFGSAVNGVQLVYELDTPITYQLTPQQVNALVGVNTVWSDADNIDLTFLKKR